MKSQRGAGWLQSPPAPREVTVEELGQGVLWPPPKSGHRSQEGGRRKTKYPEPNRPGKRLPPGPGGALTTLGGHPLAPLSGQSIQPNGPHLRDTHQVTPSPRTARCRATFSFSCPEVRQLKVLTGERIRQVNGYQAVVHPHYGAPLGNRNESTPRMWASPE